MSSTNHFERQLCASSEAAFEPSALFGIGKKKNKIMYFYRVKGEDIERLEQAAESSANEEWTVEDILLEPTVSQRKLGSPSLKFDVAKRRGTAGKEKWELVFLIANRRYTEYVNTMELVVNEILPKTNQWATKVELKNDSQ